MYKKNISLLLFTLTLGLGNVFSQIPEDYSLYYALDGNAEDQSANANTGTITGAIFVSDRFGIADAALSFDGNGNVLSSTFSTEPRTISLWFRTKTTSSNDTIFSWGRDKSIDYLYGYELTSNGSSLKFSFPVYDGSSSPYNISLNDIASGYNDNLWHHFAVTNNGTSITVHFDNEIVATSTPTDLPYWEGSNGALVFGSGFEGEIDDVRFYSSVLTESQRLSLYNEGAIAKYEFNGNALDVSGNGNNGTVAQALLTEDRFGNTSAYSFEANGHRIIIPDADELDFAANDFTLNVWVRTSASSLQRIISKGSFTSSAGYMMSTNQDGTLLFEMNGIGLATSNKSINDGRWHMLTVVVDRDLSTSLYIDGFLDIVNFDGTETIDPTNTTSITIGVHAATSEQFIGQIDDITIFNRTISGDYIAELSALNGWEPGLVADFSFTQGSFDESINSNSATNFGATLTSDRFGSLDNAFSFDGNDRIGYPHSEDYSFGLTTDFTMVGWFNSSTVTSSTGMILHKSGARIGYYIWLKEDGSLEFRFSDETNDLTVITTRQGLADGEWHQYAIVVDRDQDVAFYVDGTLDNINETITSGINADDETERLSIGATNVGTIDFTGLIDDIRIYKRTLAESEVLSSFNNNVNAVSITGSALTQNLALSLTGSAGDSRSTWSTVSKLSAGALSFSLGNATLYGDSNLDGTAETGGNAINVTAGIYYFEFRPSVNSYKVSEITSVGFLGSARTGDDSGWNDPDTDMTDLENGVYELKELSLFDGDWKIRANDTWDQGNWGDDNDDGVFELAGANIGSAVGVYNITANILTNEYSVTASNVGEVSYQKNPIARLADLSGSVSFTSSFTTINGLDFNQDGTRLYVGDRVTLAIYEYELTTAFDVTTAVSTGSSLSVASFISTSNQYDFDISNNGNHLYLLDNANNRVIYFTIANPYEIASATNAGAYSYGSFETSAFGLDISPTGDKLFIAGNGVDAILQFNIAESFNLSTNSSATFAGSFSLTSEFTSPSPVGLAFNQIGTEMYVSGPSSILQIYKLSTPFTVNTATASESIDLPDLTSKGSMYFGNAGKTIYIIDGSISGVQALEFGSDAFVESLNNDGSVEGALTVRITGDTFVNAGGNLIEGEDYQIINLPEGLTPGAVVTADGSGVTITLQGNSENSRTADNINDLELNFFNRAFENSANLNIANSANGTVGGLGISFTDANSFLVGEYLFNSDAFDSSTLENAGVLGDGSTSATIPTGTIDRFSNASSAFNFSGTSYISIPHVDQFNYGTDNDFVISTWLATTANSGVLFDKSDGTTGILALMTDEGQVDFWLVTSGTIQAQITTTTSVNDGDWHHYAIVVDRDNELKAYVDGNLDASQESAPTDGFDISVTENWLLGAAGGVNNAGLNTFFVGAIDDLKLYSQPLNEEEILDLYRNGVSAASLNQISFSDGSELDLLGSLGSKSLFATVENIVTSGGYSYSLNGSTDTYGDTNLDGVLDLNGDVIGLTDGLTHFNFDTKNLAYNSTLVESVAVLGTALEGFEVTDDLNLTDFGNGLFGLDQVLLSDGEIKFRANDAWNINWGNDTNDSGITNAAFAEGFDDESPDFTSFGGNIHSTIANPDKSGINVSDSVLQINNGNETFSGSFFDIDEKLQISEASTIKVKVWSPLSNANFRLKLEDSSDNTLFQEFDQSTNVTEQWTEVVFHLDTDINDQPAATVAYDRIVLFPGWDVADAGTFYIDDIVFGLDEIILDGANIQVTAGFYDILVDVVNNNFTIYEIPEGRLDYAISPNISRAEYLGNSFGISEDSDPTDVAFSRDGSRMYVIGLASDAVNQYDLVDPFDISTASFSASFSISAQETNPFALEFNNDGSKMYMVGNSSLKNNAVYEYDLSTPFDVSTAAYNENLFEVETDDSLPRGLAFNLDGSKMYMTGGSNSAILTYDLETVFDVTSAVFNSSTSITESTELMNMDFNADGSMLYLIGRDNGSIYQYELAAPYEVSTAMTLVQSSQFTEEGLIDGITFSTDGTYMYLVGELSATVYEYDLDQFAFYESDADDGFIEGALIVSLTGDTFTQSATFDMGNVPDGITPQFELKNNNQTATVTFAGKATSNSDSDDVLDLTFEWTNESFEINPAFNVINASGPYSSELGIDFIGSAGLVGYYTFDNGSTDDFSGSGNNGVTVNSPLFSKDRYGNDASSFEPENNETYIEIAHNGDFDFRGEFTVAMWVRLNDYSDEVRDILFKDDGFGILTIDGFGRLAYDWNDGTSNLGLISADGEVRIQRNQWTYIALTVDENADARIFVNGQTQVNNFVRDANIIGSPAAVFSISQTVNVGNTAYLSTNVFTDEFLSDANGDIDDVRIYSGTSLTQSEVQQIYTDEVSGGDDRLVAQFDFMAGELGDISGNHFDGDFRNAAGNSIGVQLTTGLNGDANGALYFDNNGDFMDVFHERSINLQNNFTVNFWINPEVADGTFGEVMFSDQNGSRLMYNSSNEIFYHYENTNGDFPSVVETGNSFEVGTWQMISYSISDGNLKVYKNGVEIIDGDVSDFQYKLSSSFTAAQNDGVGTSDPRYLQGAMDNVSVYQRVLSPEELVQIFDEDDNRLIAYYPFNEDVLDYSDNGYNGFAVDAIFDTDRNDDSDQAVAFDGSTSYVEASVSSHPTGEVSVTYMAWIYPNTENATSGIINVGEDVDNGRSALLLDNGQLAYIGQSNDFGSGITVSANQWSHVAVTKNGTIVDFYLNGELVSSGSTVSGQNVQSGFTTIGSSFGSREYFDGKIDEVRIYNQPISEAQINNIFNEEAPNLIGYYTFDEGASVDYSVYGYDLTPNNVALAADRYGFENRAADFNGVDGYLQGPVMEQLSTGSPFSISTWVNWRNGSANEENIVSWYVESGSATYLGTLGSNIRFGDENQDVGVALPENEWVHLVATYDGQNGEIYLNNSLVSSQLMGTYSFGDFVVGRQGVLNSEYFDGVIDDIRIYKSHLNAADVEKIFFEEAPATEPPAAPTDLSAEVTGSEDVRLHWIDNSDNETSFVVEIGNGTETQTLETVEYIYNEFTGLTYLDISGLTTDINYSFTIYAKNIVGNSDPSNTVSATPVRLENPIIVDSDFPSLDEAFSITVDLSRLYPVGALDTVSRLYLHSGLVEPGNENKPGWNPNRTWGEDNGIGLMTNNLDGTWSIDIDEPRTFYGVNDDFVASQIGLLFTNANASAVGTADYDDVNETGDIFIDLYDIELRPRVESIAANLDGNANLFLNGTDYTTPTALIGNTNLTVEAWVNLTSFPALNDAARVFQREISTTIPIAIFFSTDANGTYVAFQVNNADETEQGLAGVYIDDSILNEWHHFAGTYDGSTLSLYADGYLIAQQTNSITLPTSIGDSGERISIGQNVNGQIDDVRLWGNARSQTEIRLNLSSEFSEVQDNLVGNWNFNSRYSSGGTFFTPDISGFSNDLQLSGESIIQVSDLTVAISTRPENAVLGKSGYEVIGQISNLTPSQASVNQNIGIRLYLSTDNILSLSDDIELATATESISLVVGQSQNYTLPFTVPDNIMLGSYNLLVFIDYNEILLESNEDNNVSNAATVNIVDILSTPTNLVLSNETNTTFDFGWDALDASAWEYDVATNSTFTAIVNNLSAVSTTQNSGTIESLDLGTTYFFRVRAVDSNIAQRESDYSGTEQINTEDFVDTTFPTIFISGALNKSELVDQNVTVSFNDDVAVTFVEVLARGGAASNGTENVIFSQNTPTTSSLNVTIPSSSWDDYGVTFFARASDEAGNITESNVFTTILDIPATEQQTIPVNAVGTAQTSYRMFAFPYEQKSTSQVIQGAESTNDWKIQQYNASSGSNSNASTLRAGEGYWFLKRNNDISISFDNASPVSVNGESFEISLDAGWTQIGNPFLGTINWEAVLNYNGIPLNDEVSILQSYIGGGYSIISNIQAYQGVFVFSTQARDIQVPLSSVNREGDRGRSWVNESGGWETTIKLFAPNNLKSFASGFGQIKNAQIGQDKFDIRTAPLFNEFIRAEFVEEESLLSKNFARSYHDIATNDSWLMKVYSHFEEGAPMTMELESLPDLANNEMVAMLDLETGFSSIITQDFNYSFRYKDGYQMKFVKGTPDFVNQNIVLNQLMISEIYPNPSNGLIQLSLNSPEFEIAPNLKFNIYSLSGNVVLSNETSLVQGHQVIELDLRSMGLTNGLYMLEIEFQHKTTNMFEKITKKVYLKGSE